MGYSSSIYASTPLKCVGKPIEDKWKKMKQINLDNDTEDGIDDTLASSRRKGSIYNTAQLKKVETPKEETWKTLRNNGSNDIDSLYSTSKLRAVARPVEEKWKNKNARDASEATTAHPSLYKKDSDEDAMPTGETTGEINIERSQNPNHAGDEENVTGDEEFDITEFKEAAERSENKRLLMLISSSSGRHEQKTAQDRALTILKGMGIDPEQLELIDGSDPDHRQRRNDLFAISGIRAMYPQFFTVDADDNIKFLANWESFEFMHDSGSLSDSMKLHTPELDSASLFDENDATIKIQSLARGYISRIEVHAMLQKLIDELKVGKISKTKAVASAANATEASKLQQQQQQQVEAAAAAGLLAKEQQEAAALQLRQQK